MTLDLTPAPAAASPLAMAWRQSRFEARLLLRNGEQVLLALVIPVLLVLGAAYIPYLDGDRAARLAFAVPGTLALAVLSSGFTSLAISTGFERRYGVLRLLAVSPLGRVGLMAGKGSAVVHVLVAQVVIICVVGVLVGWRPSGNPLSVVVLLALGCVAFVSLALLLAGTLRAEATLALANLVFLILLLASGIAFPLDDVPAGVREVLALLPSTALADGLRSVLADGTALPWGDAAVLTVWGACAGAAAARWFRWD